jgi:hypothetical protein
MEAIHRTGPNLNAETFASSLRAVATRPATSQPFYRWGDHAIWEDGDFSGIEDAALFWWDTTVVGPDERRRNGQGMIRIADAGKRYLPGEWPLEERLFIVEGSVTIFESVPTGEEIPEYPSPAGPVSEGMAPLPLEDSVPDSSPDPSTSDPTSSSTTSPSATTGAFPEG